MLGVPATGLAANHSFKLFEATGLAANHFGKLRLAHGCDPCARP